MSELLFIAFIMVAAAERSIALLGTEMLLSSIR
jgi:hypothetical protein